MARPTQDQRKLQAADKLYEACKIAEMRIRNHMEKRKEKDAERKADVVVLKIIMTALEAYEGPEFNESNLLTNKT